MNKTEDLEETLEEFLLDNSRISAIENINHFLIATYDGRVIDENDFVALRYFKALKINLHHMFFF